MKISQKGIDAIKFFEGFRHKAYLDSVGIPTIGYGDTAVFGVPVKLGETITKEVAEESLKDDVGSFEAAVNAAIKVPTTQNEFDALVCIAYNIGIVGMKGSTFMRKHNAGDKKGCAEAMKLWCKGTIKGKKVTIQGLLNRRILEGDIYLHGKYPA